MGNTICSDDPLNKQDNYNKFIYLLDERIKLDKSLTKLSYKKGTRQPEGEYVYDSSNYDLSIFFINRSIIFVSILDTEYILKTTMNISEDEIKISTRSKRFTQNKYNCIDYWYNFDDFFIFLEKIKTIRRTNKWDWNGSNHHLLFQKESNYRTNKILKPVYQEILNQLNKANIKYIEDKVYDETSIYCVYVYYHLYIKVKNDSKEYINCSVMLELWNSSITSYRIEICCNLSDNQIEMLNLNNINVYKDDNSINHFYNIEEFIKLIIFLNN